MAIYSKLNNSDGKTLVQRIKNKGMAYLTPLILLAGCKEYNEAYINDNYHLKLTPKGDGGTLIVHEKPTFLGIHWLGREQKFYFDINQDSVGRIMYMQSERVELKKYCDDKNPLPFNEKCYSSQKDDVVDKERIEAKQSYLRNEWIKVKKITIGQLRD